MLLNEISEGSPIIIKQAKEWDEPAHIIVRFPTGSTYKYSFRDDRQQHDLIRRYGRNIGRLVARLRSLGLDCVKL